ncbi:hypothetical protein [Shouchella clausii]|uniref:hypothetical protein n=1 Tax=Shouchella clausii TaxID=79880 RepID=UPI0015C8A5E6|nr:hypothetical protein [Shouchella clausii]
MKKLFKIIAVVAVTGAIFISTQTSVDLVDSPEGVKTPTDNSGGPSMPGNT